MKSVLAILTLGLLVSTGFAQTPRSPSRNAQVITRSAEQPYLGIGARDIDAESAKKFNLKEVRGSEVTSITPDSPAAKAGLKEGDVILEFNGQPIEGNEQLSRMVRETPVGRQVKLGIWREGRIQTLAATIEAQKGPRMFVFNGNPADMEQFKELQDQFKNFHMPEMNVMPGMPFPSNTPMLGIMGETLGQEKQLAEYFGVEDGVLVKSVTRGGAAEKAGIKAGDVILKVDDTRVSTTRDISMALRSARTKKTVTVLVMRNHKETPFTVTIENAATGGLGTPVRAALMPFGRPVLLLQLAPDHRVI